MFSKGYSTGILHMPCGNTVVIIIIRDCLSKWLGNGRCQTVINHCKIILTVISCQVPLHLVHGMLWHWLDLQRGWLYFYIPNVSGMDLRTEISCVWSVCCGNPRVPLGLSSSNYSDTILRCEKGETSAPHFHQLTTLRVVIPTKSLLVQRQSPVSH